ncbi:MAG: DUF2290 domain-containing protein [Ferrovibrio sp.]
MAKQLSIEEAFTNPAPLKPSEKFRDLAIDTTIHYEDLYLCGLAESQYNFILHDYSYFQFGIEEEHKVRYAYYPNPFFGASQEAMGALDEMREYVEEGLITYEDYLHQVSDLKLAQHPPVVRYENAPHQYSELVHPCSHFHFGHHASNRWPSRRVLTPSSFALLIFKYFYFDDWHKAAIGNIEGAINGFDQILIDARAECRVLPEALFSNRELSQPHFF